MPLKVRLSSPDANLTAYKAKIRKIMEDENKEAIKKWLKTVLSRTPTYTGTARGTYAPVGRLVGRLVRKGRIKGNIERAKQKKYFVYKGKVYPLGFAAGANYQDHQIKLIVRSNTITTIFIFDQKLPYVLWNEIQPGPSWFNFQTPPPWKALEKGEISYDNHFRRVVFRKIGATKLIIGDRVVKSA
jgi:hypothetical protein